MRIRIPSKRRDAEFFVLAADTLADCPGIDWLRPNFQTGSILLGYNSDTTPEQIAEFAQTHQLFSLSSASHEADPVSEKARPGLATLEGGLQRLSVRGIDLRSAAFLVLLILGLAQIFRGQIMAPAVTLLWYALEALKFPPGDEGSQ